jgi:hypothetical protein
MLVDPAKFPLLSAATREVAMNRADPVPVGNVSMGDQVGGHVG